MFLNMFIEIDIMKMLIRMIQRQRRSDAVAEESPYDDRSREHKTNREKPRTLLLLRWQWTLTVFNLPEEKTNEV